AQLEKAPAWLRGWLSRALQVDPTRRPSAQELLGMARRLDPAVVAFHETTTPNGTKRLPVGDGYADLPPPGEYRQPAPPPTPPAGGGEAAALRARARAGQAAARAAQARPARGRLPTAAATRDAVAEEVHPARRAQALPGRQPAHRPAPAGHADLADRDDACHV